MDREAAAEAVLQAVRARPGLLQDALGGVAGGALDTVREAVRSAVADPVTESAEEESLKDSWRKAGMRNSQIAAALANLRERRRYEASGAPAADGRRPPSWIPAHVVARLPEEFGLGREGKKAGTWRWEDPRNEGNSVRIDPGNPKRTHPEERFDDIVHFFFDDTALADRIEDCIGWYVRDLREASYIRAVVEATDVVFAKYGTELGDAEYVAKPEWAQVLATAKAALAVVSEPDAAAQA